MLLAALGRAAAAAGGSAAAAATAAAVAATAAPAAAGAGAALLRQLGAQQQAAAGARHISSSRPAGDLRDFLDAVDPGTATFGRSWLAHELRNKSWDDLHKLWYVCLKERNMLLTQMGWARDERAAGLRQEYTARYIRVKKTMNRIKQVLSERAHNEADAVKSADMKRVIHYM